TWYAAKQRWDMSPGYDVKNHASFTRSVILECLVCHAGRVEPVDGALSRFKLHEHAIGCENCHGPGSLHQQRHRAAAAKGDEGEDWTIVNPRKLSRSLLESVCAHCHQHGAVSVFVRGRQPTDFRPGTPLTDYRIDYVFDVGSEQMTVVGHMEQLRKSRCYQKSPEMTCITCHHPHPRQPTKDVVAEQRGMCLSCHAAESCSLPTAKRHQKEPADNCVVCHMPRGDTDIPHLAFTHHRIGRHQPGQPAPTSLPNLVPATDTGNLSELDRQRNLGIAYVRVAQIPKYAEFADVFRQRGEQLLSKVYEAGLRRDDLAESLWTLTRTTDYERSLDYARDIVAAKDATPHFRVRAQVALAYYELRHGEFERGLSLLQELTTLQRNAEDWRLLGLAHLERGQTKTALAALQKALTIQPFEPLYHFALAEVYQRIGETERSAEHKQKGRRLQEHLGNTKLGDAP
ncbi:MAG: tetratricopeptide repeat protein, partial [Gemmataceae bacterium]|nr:tetratricopeptide repeat protein [Gemmataceae bacterium]